MTRASASWVCYVVRAPLHGLPAARDALLPTLRRLAGSRGQRFNFNTYADPRDPHLSLRVRGRNRGVERDLAGLRKRGVIRSWARRDYAEDAWVREAYEVGTRLYLRLLDEVARIGPSRVPDDRFYSLVFHGLRDNLACENQDAEVAWLKKWVLGVNRGAIIVREVQEAALAAGDAADAAELRKRVRKALEADE